MTLKSLILAFPVLCLACNNPGTPSDPASQEDASPLIAKKVTGVNTLVTDFKYDEPCTILGEEYVRSTFRLEETIKLTETTGHDGCEFAWEGNKVMISFVGTRPFASVFTAAYMFDKMYQGKQPAPDAAPEADSSEVETATSSEGATPNATATAELNARPTMNSNQSSIRPGSAPNSGVATGKAVGDLGDKAIWDEAKGTLHVLYNNNIINIMVSTKGNPHLREEQAKSMAEVLVDKIAEKEYTHAL